MRKAGVKDPDHSGNTANWNGKPFAYGTNAYFAGLDPGGRMFGSWQNIVSNLDKAPSPASRSMIQDMTVWYPANSGYQSHFTNNHPAGKDGRYAQLWIRQESWPDGMLTHGNYLVFQPDPVPEDATAGASIAFYDGHAEFVDASRLEPVGPTAHPWEIYSVLVGPY